MIAKDLQRAAEPLKCKISLRILRIALRFPAVIYFFSYLQYIAFKGFVRYLSILSKIIWVLTPFLKVRHIFSALFR